MREKEKHEMHLMHLKHQSTKARRAEKAEKKKKKKSPFSHQMTWAGGDQVESGDGMTCPHSKIIIVQRNII